MKVSICATASSFVIKDFMQSVSFLVDSGFEPLLFQNIYKKELFTAGTAKERSKDLIDAIRIKDSKAIFFARGGYGSVQVLPFLDKLNIKNEIKQKTFIGFSDLTALFSYLYTKYNKACIYGPNLVSPEFRNKTLINNTLSKKELKIKVQVLNSSGVKKIKAPMFGGCLTVLASLCGTPYIKNLDGHILFIEDSNEAPYKIDRMLNQLYMSGIIKKIEAIAVGTMTNCESGTVSWKDVLKDFSNKLNIPVVYDIKAGHGGFKYAVPLGIEAELDISKKELIIKTWKN